MHNSPSTVSRAFKLILLIVGVLYGAPGLLTCPAQGVINPVVIRFEGAPPDTGHFVDSHDEGDFLFFSPTGRFVWYAGRLEGFPANGTAYISVGAGDSVAIVSLNGWDFNAHSLDLAEFSIEFPRPYNLPVIGYRADGSTVTTNFVTDGVIDGTGPLADFETFYFGPEFTGLNRLDFPTYGWSMDNVTFSFTVPEPTSAVLCLLGAALCAARARRKCK